MASRSRIQSMSEEQLNRLTKPELIKLMKSAETEGVSVGAGSSGNAQLSDLIKSVEASLKKEMHDIIGGVCKEIEVVKKENQALRNDVDLLKKAVDAQQEVIERLEKHRRSQNVIVYGIPVSGEFSGCSTDREKAKSVFDKMDPGFEGNCISDCFRLGDGDNAPLLVRFRDARMVEAILRKKQVLKDDDTFGGVFVNRDRTPREQKERNRLLKEFRKAKNDPGNSAKRVVLQHGKLTIDGVVVDSMQLDSFLL